MLKLSFRFICRRVLMEEMLRAWSAARPALALPAGQRVGVCVGCMYHEYLSVTAAATGGKPPPQVRSFRGLEACAAASASFKAPRVNNHHSMAQAFVGNGAPYMCGRISYTFGFSGRFDC